MAITSRPLVEEIEAGSPWQPLLTAFWLLVAGIIWLIGLTMTYTIAAFVPLALPLTVVLAVAVQAALSKIEAPIWNWRLRQLRDEDGRLIFYERPRWYFFGPVIEMPALRPITKIEWTAQAIDTLINIGGVWLIIKVAHTLPPVVAIAEMFGTAPQPLTGWAALGWCAMLGAFVAGAPELIRARMLED
jgi:hypothetical protein